MSKKAKAKVEAITEEIEKLGQNEKSEERVAKLSDVAAEVDAKATKGPKTVKLDDEDREIFVALFDQQSQLRALIADTALQIQAAQDVQRERIKRLQEVNQRLQQEFRVIDRRYGLDKSKARYNWDAKRETFVREDSED